MDEQDGKDKKPQTILFILSIHVREALKGSWIESKPASGRKISRRSLCKLGTLTLGGLAFPGGCRPPAAPKRRWNSMEELIKALDGPHNYLPTPFHANYDLNAEGLRRNVAYHAERDRLTVVVGGGYGEGWKLSLEEHQELVAAAVAGAQGRMPVMAGAIGGYKISIQMAMNAEKAGADALLIFPPRGRNWPAESYYEYYKDIVTSVRIGVVILPSGQHDFWPDVLIRLAQIPNMMGFFPSLGPDDDYYPRTGGQILQAVSKPLLFVAENEPAAADSFPRGSRAYSTAAAALVPEASRRFWKYGVSGKTEKMNEVLKKELDPILKIRSYKPGYGVSGVKVAMEALGRAGGPIRPPGRQVDPGDRAGIAEILRAHSETKALVVPGFA